MNRSVALVFMLLVLALGVFATPQAAGAQSPADDLASLARHVNAAFARLDAGDLDGARSEYAAFDDGWRSIEDEIRDQSRACYTEIEGAMGDVQFALQAVPFSAVTARQSLERLNAACTAFITGQPTPGNETAAAASEEVTLSSIVGHLDKALALLDKPDVNGAAAQIGLFRREWVEVEGLVKAKSSQAYSGTENNMAKAFTLLTQPSPDVAEARATIARMKTDLAPFVESEVRYGAFDAAIILLREGLEALLVVAALLTFLKKTNNGDKIGWIWAGGGTGIIASLVVAFIVNLVFSRAAAGTNRELLEGLTGLVAAAMLIYVSIWLHSKANLNAWQTYVHDKSTAALARNSLISLALIAFLAVFREGAETVLFYVGITPSIAFGDLALGLAIGVAGLGVAGVLMLAFGVRAPVRPFFLGASLLIYYLAFKFVGTGIHALQVAGTLPATTVDYLPENGFLGLFPTWQTTGVQIGLLMVAVFVVVVHYLRSNTRSKQPGKAII
ncbi:MAG: FTR1 family protein [Dehalococcoidia bacterium]|nr:FTR1 family protein [Dehalococcoidia bacterium]